MHIATWHSSMPATFPLYMALTGFCIQYVIYANNICGHTSTIMIARVRHLCQQQRPSHLTP